MKNAVTLFALLLGLVFLPAAFPQSPPAGRPALSLRFYYAGFGFPGEEENPRAKFLLRNGRETVALALNPNAFSRELAYTGPLPIALFRERRTDSGLTRDELGGLSCPADWQGVLFVVTRDPANQRLPFRFFPVECWAPAIPAGSARVMNLCPSPLAARVGSSQAMVAARSTSDLPLPAGRPDVPLGVAVQIGEKWKRILSTAIDRPARGRMLLLVFPNPDGSPRVLVVKDLPGPPDAATAASP